MRSIAQGSRRSSSGVCEANRDRVINDNDRVSGAYAAAGVDTSQADVGVDALVEVLRQIDPGRAPLAIPLPRHYASVLRVTSDLGIALATDSVGSAVGTVALARLVDGLASGPGDALIGLPGSGVHSNGLSLARRALLDDGGLSLKATPPELGGASVGDALLEPTAIYVRAILAL